jgi:Tfp pilus tip-associated adhesin PilY1
VFDGDDGHGELLTFIVKPDGSFDYRLKTDGSLDRDYYHWAAHTKLTNTAPAARQIITNSDNSTGVAFKWSALSNAIKTTAFGGTDSTAQAKLNWLRGSRTDETPSGLRFRKRNLNSILGPIVSSNPTEQYGTERRSKTLRIAILPYKLFINNFANFRNDLFLFSFVPEFSCLI